jgi:hypothetical protein
MPSKSLWVTIFSYPLEFVLSEEAIGGIRSIRNINRDEKTGQFYHRSILLAHPQFFLDTYMWFVIHVPHNG